MMEKLANLQESFRAEKKPPEGYQSQRAAFYVVTSMLPTCKESL